ncbi:MAG: cyclic nucleotide-binding domain-containing protein [Oscillatoriales cyanobacterium SM2_1_8]|nr:cyclic nucleotide-binding domain-containing protein [Oscillatoriales cyanobacterium SM2_1_8]
MLEAVVQGVLGASGLGLGAIVGTVWQPRRVVSATVMAFGSGTLISAVSYEVALTAFRDGGPWPLLGGFAVGSSLFIGITRLVDEQGGFLRKSASRRRFLFERRREETSAVLARVAHVEVMRNLPPGEAQAMVSLLHPMSVESGEAICREGEPGDSFYLIVEGEADVVKGDRPVAVLGPGEVFGEMALLTHQPRSASVVARTPMELYQLKQEHFDDVMSRSPHIAGALSRALARRLRSATESQARAVQDLDRWRRQVLDSAEIDLSSAEEERLIEGLLEASRSAPLAILVGTMLDNIPESIAIGIDSTNPNTTLAFLLAVFLSNFPEALSSSMGLRQAGLRRSRILLLWAVAILLCGAFAGLGSFLAGTVPPVGLAFVRALSGGAILAMLSSTIIPEAYELGGASVAFSTIAGFTVGFLLSSPA